MLNNIIDLIILIAAGIVGGNAAGTVSSHYDLGRVWNTMCGAVGGAVGWVIVRLATPFLGDGGPAFIIFSVVAGSVVGGIATISCSTFKRAAADD